MAAWQARLDIIVSDEDSEPWRDWQNFKDLCQGLDHLYQAAGSLTKDGEELHWGDRKTNDAALFLDDHEKRLTVRIDLREPYQAFVADLVNELVEFKLLLDSNGSFVVLNVPNIVKAIKCSRASVFVRNPSAWGRS